ncbi:Cytochrome c family protein [Ignavibacterium album JCM 16511]|uniref:Cytochrome c family protein n=1 Tax=Ignavibacterium album (strain DSM 19864 / JCM 16511 / NBRC 101810 / Mat9-16) TaxID=945713 RepID=I0AKN6_IGNAJ|nr:CxxxxCH/CxxCH domain-containing protein [Ignavibacterium album]AFH49543.1 Cytochrome c family protein [Ignavibacterium album JCM 16511]
MKTRIFLLLISSTLTLIFTSCSDMRVDVQPAPEVGVHPEGIINPKSSNFHGVLIQNINWKMNECQNCHAADYSGGITGASCLTCHTQPAGPEACNTCHGVFNNPNIIAPNKGAHYKHLYTASSGKSVECIACHIVPEQFKSVGHIDDSKGAEINFGSIALTETNEPGTQDYDASLSLFTPVPTYNKTSQTCSNTYCHGYFKNGNTENAVSFTVGSNGAKCGSCHGDAATGNPLPKTSAQGGTHPNVTSCNACHSGVVDLVNGNWVISDPTKHINGLLNIFGQERDY